jgi:hypothetical protein
MAGSSYEDRWEGAWTADLEVLQGLKQHGDQPEIAREIDVTFRGPADSLAELADAAGTFGFTVDKHVDAADGDEPGLILVRTQTTEVSAIRELAETYLKIEDSFGVDCDGWGCVAQSE